jgi:tetratricopeptide (TPR) repeat protein
VIRDFNTKSGITVIGFALAVVTILIYLPVRHFAFLNWDDLSYVSTNDYVKGGVTWDGIVWSLTHSHSANWFPLTWISHMVDCQIYALNPAGHHLTNVLLHSANTVLLFVLLWKLTSSVWRSALVAALFGLHPLHVESVAWISERKDVLSTFFGLLTLLAYAKYVSNEERRWETKFEVRDPKSEAIPKAENRKHFALPYILALLFFALGLMSKPMLVTLPFVLLLLDFWPLQRLQLATINQQRSNIQLLLEKVPFFALTLASCIITVVSQNRAGAVASIQAIPFASRLENAVVAYIEYLAKFFWPANLSPLYPHPAHWPLWQVVGSATLLLVLTILVWFARKRFPYALTGWFWYLGTLVPVIGIVQVGSQAFADRYTYIPLIGIMIAVVWLVPINTSLQRGVPTARQLANRFNGLPTLGVVLSVVILGILSWRTSLQLGYWRDTETLFGRVLDLAPDSVQALYGLGSHLIDLGKVEEGKKLVGRAVALQPTYAEALGTLGNTSDGEGKYGEAIQYFDSALKVEPDNPSILNNLAWLRAACTDANYRDGQEAVRLATRACELVGYGKPLFVGTLAAAQAEAGDFQAAIGTAERAATLARSLRLEDIAARNRELIELYRQGKAAHGGSPGNVNRKMR